jgi:hypothetical protein
MMVKLDEFQQGKLSRRKGKKELMFHHIYDGKNAFVFPKHQLVCRSQTNIFFLPLFSVSD